MNISRKNFLVGAAATAITAPAVDGASLGGMSGRARGLMGGCFTGCMMAQHGGGGIPTARDYVQSGLINMWDGIENDGWGNHYSGEFVTWVDLIGGVILRPWNNSTKMFMSWTSNSLYNSGSSDATNLIRCAELTDLAYIEICVNTENLTTANNLGIVKNGSRTAGNLYVIKRSTDIQTIQYNSYGYNSVVDGFQTFGVSTTVPSDPSLYRNGQLASRKAINDSWGVTDSSFQVFKSMYNVMKGHMHCIRIYDRDLSASQIAANYAIDQQRFGVA